MKHVHAAQAKNSSNAMANWFRGKWSCLKIGFKKFQPVSFTAVLISIFIASVWCFDLLYNPNIFNGLLAGFIALVVAWLNYFQNELKFRFELYEKRLDLIKKLYKFESFTTKNFELVSNIKSYKDLSKTKAEILDNPNLPKEEETKLKEIELEIATFENSENELYYEDLKEIILVSQTFKYEIDMLFKNKTILTYNKDLSSSFKERLNGDNEKTKREFEINFEKLTNLIAEETKLYR